MAYVNTRVLSTSDRILQGSGKLTADGVDVGGYDGPIALDWGQTEMFVKSDWQMGEVDGENGSATLQVQVNLEEATLENIAIGYGIHTSSVLSGTSSKVLSLDPPQTMRQVALVFEGMSGTNRELLRTVSLPKCVKIGACGMKFYKGTKLVVPVTFKCFMASGTFGTITDATV